MKRGIRTFFTRQERQEAAAAKRIQAATAHEAKCGWDYTLKSYVRFAFSPMELTKEHQRRLTVLLQGLRDLYGGDWRRLARAMRVSERTLEGAWRGEPRHVSYGLCVYVAECSAMTEDRFFRQRSFQSPWTSVGILDYMLSLEGADDTDAEEDLPLELPEGEESSPEDASP
jgi:hypothetical protein